MENCMKKFMSKLLLVLLFNMLILQNAVFATSVLVPSGTPVAVYLENKIDRMEEIINYIKNLCYIKNLFKK